MVNDSCVWYLVSPIANVLCPEESDLREFLSAALYGAAQSMLRPIELRFVRLNLKKISSVRSSAARYCSVEDKDLI